VRRREFITFLGAIATWPLAARAQQAPMPVIGFLNSGTPEGFAPMVVAFRQGLNKAGYVEGQNLAIEYRWAQNQYDRLPALVAELVHRPVDVIAATGGMISALAAKAATSTLPIVFETGAIRLRLALLPASTDRAAISRASCCSLAYSGRSVWNCCANWCPRLP
jgi:putative ABC transport system substrate-binding protein